jgi:hypothetical protein
MPSPTERYLARYAILDRLPELTRRYQFVLTIPAFDERPDFLDRTLAENRDADTLTIVTVNAPEQASIPQQARTRDLFEAIRDRPDVVVIDRVTTPLPQRQGVGLARKLAADLACALIQRGDAACPVIFMTDADVRLPGGYFDAAANLERGTVLYPFHHESSDATLQSHADLYELHLRHYVRGLSSARSPYDYQSLGSTIAIHADSYARVRGVPRRNAGEDFYLLNKAAKVGPIFSLAGPQLSIEARRSGRVPFGTGPALMSMPDDPEAFNSYPPEVFTRLAGVLRSMRALGLRDETAELPADAEGPLMELGWQPLDFQHRHPAGPKRLRAITEWFDGFRTMRFIRMTDRSLGAVPLLETLRSEFDAPGAGPGELLAICRAREVERVSGVASGIGG